MRVKLGDVCERGTSNLKLSDVSEKEWGIFSFWCIRIYWKCRFLSARISVCRSCKKDGAGIGRGNVMPGKNFCNRYDAVSFTERQYIAKSIFFM